MAMRKGDFDALGVAPRWRESVVDDISLSQIAWRHKLRSVFVPLSITLSDNVLSTFDKATGWFTRQLLYLKAYHPRLWLIGLAISCGVFAIYALFPISILGALFTPLSFWEWGGGASLLAFASEVIAAQVVGGLRTAGTRTITWSGVRYTFDKSGKVVRVER
jgi:hypothetical protein